MKYGVSLSDKFGNQIVLGTTFKTTEAAQAYIEQNVCARCNTASIMHVHDDAEWIDRHRGFNTPAWARA